MADMNLAGQCCLIRDQEEGGIGANMASYVSAEHFTNVYLL